MADICVYNMQYGSVQFNGYEDRWYAGAPNSAGGWDVIFDVMNTSTKTIKYISVVVTPINRVGDVGVCSTRGRSQMYLEVTGPIEPNVRRHAHFETVWYDIPMGRLRLDFADVTFMDGSSRRYQPSEISTTPPAGTGGCYVATAVYGSYDCPEVWTLRRFRDYRLAETWYGRAFIHMYYAVSPTIVKWFGNTAWFQDFWRKKLDNIVRNLNNRGIESSPYNDRIW